MPVPIIAANWKMTTTIKEAKALAGSIRSRLEKLKGIQILVFPPFPAIESVLSILSKSRIAIGAQNMYFSDRGPYTGEVSPEMVVELCKYVILGHSERRLLLNESDQEVALKIQAASKYKIKPILCIGETFQQKESDQAKQVIERQLYAGTEYLENPTDLMVAYEPIWAIGTGVAATPEEAQLNMEYIRACLEKRYGAESGRKIPLLYGGSVTKENVSRFIYQKDIDGTLIGQASVNPDSFVNIVTQAAKLV
tara:strand:- start:775 stop:1530 length:756 start_codon:yes stop_codon:yes gene_type:complete